MKIAIIDHEHKFDDSIEFLLGDNLEERGLEVAVSDTMENFENQYGPIKEYDAMLIHPGLKQQGIALKRISTDLKDIKWALISKGMEGYLGSDVPIYCYIHYQEIYDFLTEE